MALSTHKKAHFTFMWTLEDPAWHAELFTVTSPEFTVESMEMTRWILKMHKGDLRFFYLTVERIDDGPESIDIDFEVSFVSADGLHLTNGRDSRKCKSKYIYYVKERAFNDIFCRRRPEFLPKGALTIRCRMWRKGVKMSEPDVCFGCTWMDKDHHCFVWAVPDISSLEMDQKKRLLISTSNVDSELVLYFNKGCDGKECLMLHFEPNCEAGIGNDFLTGEIALLDGEGTVVQSGKISQKVYRDSVCILHTNLDLEKQKLLSDKSILLRDVLHLKFDFDIIHGPLFSRIENFNKSDSLQLQTIATEMSKETLDSRILGQKVDRYYGYGSMCDVILRVGSTSFPAHKCILSNRCPVFEDMFTSDMVEKVILDMNSTTLCNLLTYIYKNEMLEVEWNSVAELFEAANNYQLLDLKQMCSEFLKSNISERNFCRILSLADMYREKELLEKVLDFISKNSDVYKSDVWKIFKEENSKLALEIMEKVNLLLKSLTIDNDARLT